MNDSAVVSTLVAGDAIFFFNQQQASAGKTSRDFESYAKTNDSSTDDNDVVRRIGHVDVARESSATN